MGTATTTLAVRLDSMGDVLLAGPALRALARHRRVLLAVSGSGEPAARMLHGVDDIVRFDGPWMLAEPPPVDAAALAAFVDAVRAHHVREAIVLTSPRQSPLPTALVLRLAGVERIVGASDQDAGSLLDVRLELDPHLHEVERALALVAAAGVAVPHDDRGRRLAVCRRPLRHGLADLLPPRYVVVHPGRSYGPEPVAGRWGEIVAELVRGGRPVVLTGTPDDLPVAHRRAAEVVDIRGRTTASELASVLAHAEAAVIGSAGVTHLATAVGTPFVSTLPGRVPAHLTRPWGARAEVAGPALPAPSLVAVLERLRAPVAASGELSA